MLTTVSHAAMAFWRSRRPKQQTRQKVKWYSEKLKSSKKEWLSSERLQYSTISLLTALFSTKTRSTGHLLLRLDKASMEWPINSILLMLRSG